MTFTTVAVVILKILAGLMIGFHLFTWWYARVLARAIDDDKDDELSEDVFVSWEIIQHYERKFAFWVIIGLAIGLFTLV